MPDPKKKKNAPANAATDTNTDGAQKMYKKRTPRPQGNGGTVGNRGQMKKIAEPLRKSVQEGALEGATTGGVLSNRRTATATPRTETIGTATATPRTETIGTATATPRTETIGTAKATPISQSTTTQPGHTNRPADPFLAGFNSDDYSVVRNRNRGGNRRQSR